MRANLRPPVGSPGRLASYNRPALAVAIVMVAYHQSLLTLINALSLDTPLAHLALVPLLALALAVAIARRSDPVGPDIHDRQVDWLIGAPLVATALVMNLLLPARLSTMFWVWRIDLLSLPVFVAGIVAILFGVRALWRQRVAVGFLFLAWPWPYNAVLDRWLESFTLLTVRALRLCLRVIPLATDAPGGDSLFNVRHAGSTIRVSVASACSGANGIVGFMLVGAALTFVVSGPRRKKLAWLAAGAGLVWLFNLLRILIVLFAARQWGEEVAFDGFHPFVGLVVFNVAVLLMVLSMNRFGLAFRPPGNRRSSGAWRPDIRRALWPALAVTAALATLNADLESNDLVSSSLGSARLAPFSQTRETPAGFEMGEVEPIDWAQRFFGNDSSWERYTFFKRPDVSTPSNSAVVYADVINTSNRNALSAYGVEACYQFHGYGIVAKRSVDLGNGVVGGILSWQSRKSKVSWTTLYWHWPIKAPNGTRYERVSLLMSDDPANETAAPSPASDASRALQISLNDRLNGSSVAATDERVRDVQLYLTASARDLVQQRILSS